MFSLISPLRTITHNVWPRVATFLVLNADGEMPLMQKGVYASASKERNINHISNEVYI